MEPTRTALDAITSSTNFGDPPGLVHETSIRVGPLDDRVIWLVTGYDESTVLGAFAALPDPEPGIVQQVVQDQARLVYAMTDLARIERAEASHAAVAGELNLDANLPDGWDGHLPDMEPRDDEEDDA